MCVAAFVSEAGPLIFLLLVGVLHAVYGDIWRLFLHDVVMAFFLCARLCNTYSEKATNQHTAFRCSTIKQVKFVKRFHRTLVTTELRIRLGWVPGSSLLGFVEARLWCQIELIGWMADWLTIT